MTSKQPLSDDEVIAEERQRHKHRMAGRVLLSMVIFGLLIVLAVVNQSDILPRIGVSYQQLVSSILTYFPMLLLLIVAIFFWRAHVSAKPPPPSVLRKQVDDDQSRQRWKMLMFVPVMFIVCLAITLSPTSLAPGAPIGAWFAPVLFPMIAVVCTLFVSIGPGFLSSRYRVALEDELERSLRAKAAKAGYALAMALLAGNYLVALAKPHWMAEVISFSVFAGFAAPALYLTWLEWRANRNG